MEYPTRRIKTALIVLRAIQVVLSLVVFILDALVLAGMVVIYSLLNDSMHSIYRGYRPRVDISGVDGSIIAVIVVFALLMLFSLISLIVSIVLLVFTANPRARARSFGGHNTRCMTYACDYGWDVALAVFFCVHLALAIWVAAAGGGSGASVVLVLFTLALEGLYIATAILSSETKKGILASTLPQTHCPRALDGADAFAPVVKPEVPTPPIKA